MTAVRPASLDEWVAAYEASPHVTFFHGPRWSRMISEYRGDHRPEPVSAELGGGSTAVLGITTAPAGIPGMRRRLVSPEGCSGGWCAPGSLSASDTIALAKLLAQGEVIWRVGPADAAIPDAALPGARDEVTHVIDLREGALAAREAWKPAARREVGRAERAGVTVRVGDGPDDWNAYRALYGKTVDRWETPLTIYADRLFEIIPRVAADEALLLLAERAGEACAGGVVFVHGRHAAYWHAASDVGAAPGAMNALQWTALELLEQRGVSWYDLLGSGPLAGVVTFKESLGGVPHRVRAVTRSTHTIATVRAAKRLLTRRWSKV
jgi:GNAT acetyltransferase-like protein